jgi:hypothetical protein
MAYAYGIGIASNPENEGKVSLDLNGSFELGKQFMITAYVVDPLDSQSLTLQLPEGLTRVDGRETQAVPPPAEGSPSVVLWKVRVDKLGELPFKVRSSNGVIHNTMLKIEASEKPEMIRIEKAPEKEPQPEPMPEPPAKKEKKGLKLQVQKDSARIDFLSPEICVDAGFLLSRKRQDKLLA